jgi:N6-adenosine-specific RNA methylase IME4
MKFHPLANLFPLLPENELNLLAEDIKQNGLHNAIWLYKGEILDGRNRFLACEKASIEPEFQEYEGGESDILPFVLSLNLSRRHLNESQRAMVAAKIANIQNGSNRFDKKVGMQICTPTNTEISATAVTPVTVSQSAEMLNVSTRAVQMAKKVKETCTPEVIEAVERGEITVSRALVEVNREEKFDAIAESCEGTPELPEKKYAVIYADPPWKYEHVKTENRAIENHYPTMDLQDICNLDIGGLTTEDAVLFMWATSPKLAEAMQVIDAWGFKYKTSAVWVKDKIGMGYYFRGQHELLLVATKGDIPAPPENARVSSVIEAARGEHSSKPHVFYSIIEKMYGTLPKIELFCRTPQSGWDVWGNQSA